MRHATKSKFDVIALHALPPQMFVPQARRGGATVVSHVHGLDWQRAKWQQTPFGLGSKVIRLAERRMVKASHAVAVCAPYLADYYRETYGLETTVVPNGIVPDDAAFEPDQELLASLGVASGRFLVSIGRLVQEKRTQDLVAAAKQVGVPLVIVGEGPENDWMRALRGSAGAGVVFAGHRRGRELETLFRSATAYVTASELEGLPSSVLEAMERRSCVIASDIPPHRLLLEAAGTSELLFPVADVDALVGRLRRVLDEGREAVANRQQSHVRAEYAWDGLAQRCSSFYRYIVANYHGAG
jgi:glycosyltransferase involved in cell wall biosynthesis